MACDLASIKNLLIDMDGVLYRGDTGLPGGPELPGFLQARNIRYLYVTNNSTLAPSQFVEKLGRIGVRATDGQIITSAVATAEYLKAVAPAEATVNVVGEAGLTSALEERGFRLAGRRADYVVCGWDRTLTFEKLATACLAIRGGATFVGTNPDKTYPLESDIIPGAGSIIAALVAATDVEPIVVGKPEPIIIEHSLRVLGAQADETAMLGDRLDTDILGGNRAGIKTIMVLTGISTAEEARVFESPPDAIYDDIPALLKAWERAVE